MVFDGTTQTITGQVSCTAQPDGKLVILVSEEGGRKSIRVLLSHDARLVVHKVGATCDEIKPVAPPRPEVPG